MQYFQLRPVSEPFNYTKERNRATSYFRDFQINKHDIHLPQHFIMEQRIVIYSNNKYVITNVLK